MYREREREREREKGRKKKRKKKRKTEIKTERKTERERENRLSCVHMYICIYVWKQRERKEVVVVTTESI